MNRLLLLLLTFSPMVFSNEKIISSLLEQATQKKLAQDSHWHKLLHYRPSFWNSSYKSDINSLEFFLAPDGRTNPANELLYTIRAFFAPHGPNINNHPQCRFIARYAWLYHILDHPKDFDQYRQHCPEYQEWSHHGKINSISVLFATGYLGNPASFFGHPLIRFNIQEQNSLLDTAVNYGAFTPLQVDPLSYAIKGIFGGYDAGFTHLNYFYSNHNYTEVELRNMWDYQLKLSPWQIEQVVGHTWELLGQKFPYYFFADNCAFRMGQLLELVITDTIKPTNTFYTIPSSLFEQLFQKKLVSNIKLIPSRQSRLANKYQALNSGEKNWAKKIIANRQNLKSQEFQNLSHQERNKILETLFDYYSFRILQNKNDLQLTNAKKQLLIERLKTPAGSINWPTINGTPPHEWQRPQMIRIGYFANSSSSNGAILHWRPAYYDHLTPDIERSQSGDLQFIDAELHYTDNNIAITQLTLFNIRSLNLSRTGLAGDGSYAWQVRSGWEQQDLAHPGHLHFALAGGMGKGVRPFKWLTTYAMLSPRLQTESNNSGNFALEPQLGALINFADFWQTDLSISKRLYFDGTQTKHNIYIWENRFINSKNWDLRAELKKHLATQITISLGLYW